MLIGCRRYESQSECSGRNSLAVKPRARPYLVVSDRNYHPYLNSFQEYLGKRHEMIVKGKIYDLMIDITL